MKIIEGAVTVASPYPLPNGEFMRVLRDAWARSREHGFQFRYPKWAAAAWDLLRPITRCRE